MCTYVLWIFQRFYLDSHHHSVFYYKSPTPKPSDRMPPPACLSIYLSTYLSIHLFIHLSIYLSLVFQDDVEKSPLGACLSELSGVKQRQGEYLGLLVHERYARRFIAESPEDRKSMEIRNKRCTFLQEGEKLLLVATSGSRSHHRRQILAVLEFQGCLKILVTDFEKYYSLHKVTPEELRSSQIHPASTKAEDGSQSHWWAWQMRTHHIFDPPLVWHDSRAGPVIWCYISPDSLSLQDPECPCSSPSTASGSTPLKRSATVESESVASFPSAKKRKSQSPQVDEVAPDLDCEEIPWDFSNPDEKVTCMILSQTEWDGIARDASAILKPFKTRDMHLCILIRRSAGYSWVGVLTLKSVEQLDAGKLDTKSLLSLTKGMYTKLELEQKKTSKNLFLWTCKDIIILSEAVPLSWIDNTWRNRTCVMTASRLKATSHVAEAKTLDLKETCQHFLQCCDPSYRDEIFETLKHLSKKTLRLATACSGTDICITVVKQTLQLLNELQAGPLIVFPQMKLLLILSDVLIFIPVLCVLDNTRKQCRYVSIHVHVCLYP